jgi:hypothetical protein
MTKTMTTILFTSVALPSEHADEKPKSFVMIRGHCGA